MVRSRWSTTTSSPADQAPCTRPPTASRAAPAEGQHARLSRRQQPHLRHADRGRQYAFSNDLSGAYDPFGGSYAFSLIGNSAQSSGTGDTETARYNTSVKYQVATTASAPARWPRSAAGTRATAPRAPTSSISAATSAASRSTRSTPTPRTPWRSATTRRRADARHAQGDARRHQRRRHRRQVQVAGADALRRLRICASAARATSTAPRTQRAATTFTLSTAAIPASIQANAYVNPKDLQVLWVARKYGILSNLDFVAGYYYAWQNNYTNAARNITTGCTSTDQAASARVRSRDGATPQGSNTRPAPVTRTPSRRCSTGVRSSASISTPA